jgi:hypothetical protein
MNVDLTFTAPAGAGSPRGTLTVTNTVDGPRTVKLEGQVQPGPILSATPSFALDRPGRPEALPTGRPVTFGTVRAPLRNWTPAKQAAQGADLG